MRTSEDELVVVIRTGLARCERRWFRKLTVALDPDAASFAERVIAQTVVEKLGRAGFQVRKPLPLVRRLAERVDG